MSHLVVAIAYDGLCIFEFGCAVEVFGLPRPELGNDGYDFAVHACDPGQWLQAVGGVQMEDVAKLITTANTPKMGCLEPADYERTV